MLLWALANGVWPYRFPTGWVIFNTAPFWAIMELPTFWVRKATAITTSRTDGNIGNYHEPGVDLLFIEPEAMGAEAGAMVKVGACTEWNESLYRYNHNIPGGRFRSYSSRLRCRYGSNYRRWLGSKKEIEFRCPRSNLRSVESGT